MLSNLILGPLKLLLEVVFALANRALPEALSIVVLSLTVNVMVLPLYRRADAIQAEAREKEARLSPMIRHIKKVFRGNEQFMMLQTFYRQQHYNPLYSLRAALPLLLQIPFFIAAYQFLGRLGCLQGATLGPVRDLSQPDGLLRVGTLTVNLIPLLMTAVNLLSGMLYTRGAQLKEKLQLLGMALVFLLLLYDSPAGLTFYWTLNNLFSLVKNGLRGLRPVRKHKRKTAPAFLRAAPRPGSFFLCCAVLAALSGLLIPSAVLSASPQDFIRYVSEPDPFWYGVNALLLAVGTFVLWFGVYYALSRPSVRKGMEYGAWMLAGVFLINYLFFRNNLGTLSSMLKYDRAPEFTVAQKLVNLGTVALAAMIFAALMLKKETVIRGAAWTMILVMGGMGARNLWLVRTEVDRTRQAQARNYAGAAEIPLSREGQNVIVLMLDRAVSSYLPCIFQEDPDLKASYSGFTYYPNTLSFGAHTNLGSPGLFGGYEYVPRAMNARNTVLLKDKQNEALLLLPTLFSRQGYQVSVFDVPYPGDYTSSGDYSVFDTLPGVNARKLIGAVQSGSVWERPENFRLRNFFCYSLSMVVPSALYGLVYNMGYYNRANGSASLFSLGGNAPAAVYTDLDYTKMDFMAAYDVLCSLKDMTRVQSGKGDTLLVMANDTTHEQVLLPEPEYAPIGIPENTAYDASHADRFHAGPFVLHVENDFQMAHYEVNMAAIKVIGEWLDYLKETGVYDNTRIILVSDHGAALGLIEEGLLETGVNSVGTNYFGTREDIMAYNPLLMMKDFGASGELRTDTTFMTNADVPSLAMRGLIADPVNPFTGQPVTDADKSRTCMVSTSHLMDAGRDKGTTFEPSYWLAVVPGGDTLFDASRWTFVPTLE